MGIGPLMKNYLVDDEFKHSIRYFFLLHIKTCSIKIESENFYVAGVEEQLREEHKNLITDFKNGYEQARKTIKDMVE